MNSDGDYLNHNIYFKYRYRLKDQSPESAWVEPDWYKLEETWTPLNRTISVPEIFANRWNDLLPVGCYEVQFKRGTAVTASPRTADDLYVVSLKGFLSDDQTSSSTTRVATWLQGSDKLGTQALTKFSGVVQRLLPVWNGSSWDADQGTQHPVWAFIDALKADYGAGLTDDRIDVVNLKAIGDSLPNRQFNGVFDTSVTLWEALTDICRPMLARPVILPNGKFSMVVDENVAEGEEVALFTNRNIVKNTFSLQHVGLAEDAPDSVEVVFFDEDQEYREASILCAPTGSSGLRPEKVKLRGVTDWIHAVLIGFRMAGEHFYRRDIISFETTSEGRIPLLGQTIKVQHYLLGQRDAYNSSSGDITAYSSGTDTITVLEDLSGLSGTCYVYLRSLIGEPLGPYTCTVSGQDITITEAYDATPLVFDDEYPRPTYAIGQASVFITRAKVRNIERVDDQRTKLECVIDDPNAYTPVGSPAPEPSTLPVPTSLVPTVSDVKMEAYGHTANPYYKVTWAMANADHARVMMCADTTASPLVWDVLDPYVRDDSLIVVPPYSANLLYAVSAVAGASSFPAFSDVIDTTSYVLTPAAVADVAIIEEFVAEAAIQWTQVPPGHGVRIETWWGGAQRRTEYLARDVTSYRYNWFHAIHDYPDFFNGVTVIRDSARDITFKLFSMNWNDDSSAEVSIELHNDQVGALPDFQYFEIGDVSLRIQYTRPDARDFQGCEIHLSENHGFTPADNTMVYIGNSNNTTISGVLEPNTTYYGRVAGFDAWGRENLNYSNEFQFTTGDDILSGGVSWANIADDDPSHPKPDDGATYSGPMSAIVDSRFDKAAAMYMLAPPHWQAYGDNIALDLTGGEGGGPCAFIQGNDTGQTLLAGPNTRLPAGNGTRVRMRVRVNKTSGFIGNIHVLMYDSSGNSYDYRNVAFTHDVASDTYQTLEGVADIDDPLCRSVLCGIYCDASTTSSHYAYFDNFEASIEGSRIAEDSAEDYFDDDAIDTPQIKGGAVVKSEVTDVATDVSFTSLSVPSAGVWSDWYDVKTYQIDAFGRKDGQAMILSDFSQTSWQIKNTNAGTISNCYLQVRLVRGDDDTIFFPIMDDDFWSAPFTMPTTGTYQYGNHLVFAPWNAQHVPAKLPIRVDLDPPDGLVSYVLRWRIKTGSTLTGLEHKPGAGRLITLLGKT